MDGIIDILLLLSALTVDRIEAFSSIRTTTPPPAARIQYNIPHYTQKQITQHNKRYRKSGRPRDTSRYIFSSDKGDDIEDDNIIQPIDESIQSQNATNSTIDDISNEQRLNTEEEILGMQSGWANIGKYLLPSWSSTQSSDSISTVISNYTTNNDNSTVIQEDETLIVQTSIFSHNGTKEDEEESNIIDVECSVDEPTPECIDADLIPETSTAEDNANSNLTSTTKRLLKGAITKSIYGGKKILQVAKEMRDSRADEVAQPNQWDSSILGEGPSLINETDIPTNTTTSEEEEVQSDNNKGSRRTRRRQQQNQSTDTNQDKSIFTSLESKDITTTTMSKQRKWERRRRRVGLALGGAKNAVLLFVATFLLGNLMNQFVDLTEDGSFEVHFGKVLSGPSPFPSQSTQSSELSESSKKAETITSPSKKMKGLLHTITTPKQSYNVDGTRAEALGLVSRAVQRVGPATVRVETETYMDADGDKAKSVEQKNEEPIDGENIEGEDRGDVFDGVPEAPPPATNDDKVNIDFGQGSGIIINSEGYVLTNAHVVEGASKVYVHLTDGRRYKVEVKGFDDIVDVAVLQIIPDETISRKQMKLPVAQLGNSDQIEVGQFVTAIGSPGGLDNTCTIGIVSGLKRCPKVVGIPDKFGVLDYLQTDAAINQGNSGGPLVDVETGNIVGINTCIRANMEGTSFAIPINKVLALVDDLSEGKHITHGYLGVHMSTMTPSLAQYYNKLQPQRNSKIPEKEGVMIEKVFRNSPAKSGGLQKYDFVTTIGGQRVTNADDAHVIIDRATIGEDLSITVMRGDNEITVQVKPEDLSPRLKQLREERLKRKKTKKRSKDTSRIVDYDAEEEDLEEEELPAESIIANM